MDAKPRRGARHLTPRELSRLGRAVPKRLRFTREGKLLFFVTLGIGFGAVNSGNNLLYLVLGVLLSLIIISGVLSELTLRALTAIRHPSPHLFVGTPALVRIDVHNEKRRAPSLSVEVAELTSEVYGLEQRRGFLLSIPAGATESAHLRVVGQQRGIVPSAGLRLTTRFPFGFFEKSRIVPLPARYMVFPKIVPLPIPRLSPVVAGAEEEIARIGQGDEFYALRDARLGEDARSIAWKVTARRDKLIVREHQRPASRRVVLVLANVVPDEAPSVLGRLETAISHVASLATVLIDSGFSVGLATCDGGVPPDASHETLVRIYEHLAGLPVRQVEAGTRVPIFEAYGRRNLERLAVVTPDQQRAGLPIEAERTVVVGPEQADTAAVPPAAPTAEAEDSAEGEVAA